MTTVTEAVNQALRQHDEARDAFIARGRALFRAEREPTDAEIDGLAMLAMKAAAAKKVAEMCADRLERTGPSN